MISDPEHLEIEDELWARLAESNNSVLAFVRTLNSVEEFDVAANMFRDDKDEQREIVKAYLQWKSKTRNEEELKERQMRQTKAQHLEAIRYVGQTIVRLWPQGQDHTSLPAGYINADRIYLKVGEMFGSLLNKYHVDRIIEALVEDGFLRHDGKFLSRTSYGLALVSSQEVAIASPESIREALQAIFPCDMPVEDSEPLEELTDAAGSVCFDQAAANKTFDLVADAGYDEPGERPEWVDDNKIKSQAEMKEYIFGADDGSDN